MRNAGFHLKSGYVVLAIPDSGLFVKEGRVVTGHETALKFNEMILFSREADAQQHAAQQVTFWENGDKNDHQWSFQVIPVLVSERL